MMGWGPGLKNIHTRLHCRLLPAIQKPAGGTPAAPDRRDACPTGRRARRKRREPRRSGEALVTESVTALWLRSLPENSEGVTARDGDCYIMPPGGIPPIPPPAPFSSGLSATIHSVVSSKLATDAAFWRALRTTLVGSMIPAFIRSSNSSVAALKPNEPLLFLILSTTIDPSHPALEAIQRAGSSSAFLMMAMPTFSSS